MCVCARLRVCVDYKNSMVRDDPAFLLVIVYILCVCAIASAVTLSSSVWHVLVLVPRFVLVDFLFIAIVTATLGWCARAHWGALTCI